jgi:hypothetical protein
MILMKTTMSQQADAVTQSSPGRQTRDNTKVNVGSYYVSSAETRG